jgi:small conductance mechanosensitive channel
VLSVFAAPVNDACGPDPSWICDHVFQWTGSEEWAKAADFFLATPVDILLILLIAVGATWAVRRGIRRLTSTIGRRAEASSLLTGAELNVRATARANTIGAVLRSLSTVVIFSIAGLMILGDLGVDIAPLIAGAGIVGIAAGFGAQSLVKDVITGFFMLVEDQYGVGDVVDVGEASGTVEAVNLRSTRIRDVNGTVWHVPNGEIHRVGNKSQQWSRAVLDVVVAHGTDIHRAADVITRVAREVAESEHWSREVLEPPEVWGIEDISPTGITIRLVAKTRPAAQFGLTRALREALSDAFTAEGINVPMVAPPAPSPPPPPAS